MAIILRYFAEFGSFVANYIQVAQPLAETALKNGLVMANSGKVEAITPFKVIQGH